MNKLKQVERIQTILKHNIVDECPHCDKQFVSFYTFEGYGLCPDCDGDAIEDFRAKQRGE